MRITALLFLMSLTALSEGIPMIPMNPAVPIEKPAEEGAETKEVWQLTKLSTFTMDCKVNVVVPLEILSDVEIKAVVIDDQKLTIPFEVEMNKEPDRMDYYSLKYSETDIDIDGDGAVDTKIYAPKYINKRIVDENYLHIDGKNISREGIHRKRVYITVELKEDRE